MVSCGFMWLWFWFPLATVVFWPIRASLMQSATQSNLEQICAFRFVQNMSWLVIFFVCHFDIQLPIQFFIRTGVWTTKFLKTNILSWFDPSEKLYLKKRLSLPPQRLLCWFTPWKNILWVEPPEKIIIKGPSRLLGSYPCMDKKCNSSILVVAGNVLILIQE